MFLLLSIDVHVQLFHKVKKDLKLASLHTMSAYIIFNLMMQLQLQIDFKCLHYFMTKQEDNFYNKKSRHEIPCDGLSDPSRVSDWKLIFTSYRNEWKPVAALKSIKNLKHCGGFWRIVNSNVNINYVI